MRIIIGLALVVILGSCASNERGKAPQIGDPAELDASPWNACVDKSTREQIAAMKAQNTEIIPEAVATTAETACADLYPEYIAELRKQTAGTQYDISGYSEAELKAKSHAALVKAADYLAKS